MQPSARGNPRVPSPGPLRPFTPPDLSSIPHMDGTPLQNNNNAHNNNASPGSARARNENRTPQEASRPFIVGSPIDLGDIDNVDNIGLRLDPRCRGRRRAREHIELQETGLPGQPNPEVGPIRTENGGSQGDDRGSSHHHDSSEERIVFVNAPHQPAKYKNNHITTAKYSCISFVPMFLFEQFRRYSNCFFLFIALMQQIPDVSPTGRYTTLVPLIFILSVSALKEIVEDIKRHRADDEINMREVEVLRDGRWQWIQWRTVAVGDVVKVHNNNFFPADLILLSSSEPQGMSFIETANLDGETNLKIRQAHPDTATLLDTAELMNFRANIQCEPPNRHLYEFNGVLRETNKQSVFLGPDQLLLRGAMLRNTRWIFGVVIYTGHDTKLMQNNTATAPLKRSTLDRLTNTQILMLFFILLLLCLLSAIFNVLWTNANNNGLWYLGLQEEMTKNFAVNLLTFIILFNNLIPISLQVTLEVVRFVQATFINMDIEMYHAETDTPAMARTSNLNEELGMVSYVFTDKTGTLTKNVMEYKRCSIGGKLYELPNPAAGEEGINESELVKDIMEGRAVGDTTHITEKKKSHHAAIVHEFMVMLSVCHTVIPEKIDDQIIYHAASPDERALVDGARKFNYVFDTRTPTYVEIIALGERLRYEVLNVIEFTSSRKRMSVIIKTPEGKIKLLCKGADSVIYERLTPQPLDNSDIEQDGFDDFRESTLEHLEMFASEGLRTLCFASADIPESLYQWWRETYHNALVSIANRENKLEHAANLIETKLTLLGATAIEDQLQDQVPETIQALLQADINVWVLTGDKQETAINIGYSCRLITHGMPLYIINEQSLDKTREVIIQRCLDFGIDLKCQNEVALIIDGNTLDYALTCDIRMDFLDLCSACKVVICCRVSPMQKAEVVELITSNKKAVTLAIGDGANDVAMIQKAHIGVGISGVEGLQAACASDYSIAQFRFLKRLLFVHGSWNYSRMCKLILYSFYKNICLYVIELWFAIYSGWSGQILFERWSIGLYNVVFTAAPPLAMGLFDKVCSAETHLAHPGLYATKNNGESSFNIKVQMAVFWVWIMNALIHSSLLYWLPLLALKQDVIWANGRDGGYLLLGNLVYTYVVVTVCAKAGLIINSWTWVTHLATWGSIILWFLFIFIYSNFWPTLNVGAVMLGNDKMLFSSPVFWLGLILIPAAALLLDVTVKAVKNTIWKSVTEAARQNEIRKSDPGDIFNSQDYRSSFRSGLNSVRDSPFFMDRSNANLVRESLDSL